MKKLAIFILILTLLSCSDNDIDPNNILPNIPVNETIFLDLPQYIDLKAVGGWAYTNGGISGIILYRSGTTNYIAWERSAPHLAPKTCSQMTVENSIIMYCSCDESKFSIIDGSPQTDGINYAAKFYRVDVLGNNTLRITNY